MTAENTLLSMGNSSDIEFLSGQKQSRISLLIASLSIERRGLCHCRDGELLRYLLVGLLIDILTPIARQKRDIFRDISAS